VDIGRGSLVVTGRGLLVAAVGTVLLLGEGAARAENLDAGKSAPALFASTCQACHASPRGLAKNTVGLTSFLQEHYTASPQSAASLAAYLTANAAAPAAKQAPASGRAAATPSEGAAGAKRRPGQAAEPAAKSEPARPPQTATARPDSMIEPVDPRRHPEETKGAKGKRQPAKQETTATPAPGAAEPPPATAPSPSSPAAAPVAAAPPPSDQPAFSAPSP
jgi:hypothetical protein